MTSHRSGMPSSSTTSASLTSSMPAQISTSRYSWKKVGQWAGEECVSMDVGPECPPARKEGASAPLRMSVSRAPQRCRMHCQLCSCCLWLSCRRSLGHSRIILMPYTNRWGLCQACAHPASQWSVEIFSPMRTERTTTGRATTPLGPSTRAWVVCWRPTSGEC